MLHNRVTVLRRMVEFSRLARSTCMNNKHGSSNLIAAVPTPNSCKLMPWPRRWWHCITCSATQPGGRNPQWGFHY